MARNPACTIYIGNLDEKVTERVLYEILIQAGRIVDLHIPRDKETNRHKGYAFAEYETKEVADYAVRLFSGLVRLHNRTLKFAMSGQDKSSRNNGTQVKADTNSTPLAKPYSQRAKGIEVPHGSTHLNANYMVPSVGSSSVNSQDSADGLVVRGLSNNNYEYSRRSFGAMRKNVSRPGSKNSIAHPSY